MKEGRVKVVIDDNKRIPFVGKGPIRTPICLTISQYEVLKKLGFKIKKVGELKHKYNTTNVSEPKDKNVSEDGVNTNEESHINYVPTNAETSGADEAFEEESTEEEDELVDDGEENTSGNKDNSEIEEDSEDIDEDLETDSDEEVVDDDSDEDMSDSDDEEVSEENEEDPDYATDEDSEGDENDEDNEEEYVDIDSLTKGEIKKRLDELGVSYGKNSNINTLKKLLMENLPE